MFLEKLPPREAFLVVVSDRLSASVQQGDGDVSLGTNRGSPTSDAHDGGLLRPWQYGIGQCEVGRCDADSQLAALFLNIPSTHWLVYRILIEEVNESQQFLIAEVPLIIQLRIIVESDECTAVQSCVEFMGIVILGSIRIHDVERLVLFARLDVYLHVLIAEGPKQVCHHLEALCLGLFVAVFQFAGTLDEGIGPTRHLRIICSRPVSFFDGRLALGLVDVPTILVKNLHWRKVHHHGVSLCADPVFVTLAEVESYVYASWIDRMYLCGALAVEETQPLSVLAHHHLFIHAEDFHLLCFRQV